jgi:GTP cyclohydrolase II
MMVLAGSFVLNPVVAATPVPPPATFFTQSWDQMNKVKAYKLDCTTVAGKLSRTAGLTTEEQHDADLVAQALKKMSIKEVDILSMTNKRISAVRESSPALLPYAWYKAGQMTYDEASLATSQTPKFTVQFVVGANALYYREKATDKWNVIKSKPLADAVLANLAKMKFTDSFDKASFKFDSWDPGKTKVASFKGQLTPSNASSMAAEGNSSAFTLIPGTNTVRVHIDSKTKNWTKLEALVNVDNGKISYPLTRTCLVTYGTAAKVVIPASAKSIDVEAGSQAFLKLMNATQQ